MDLLYADIAVHTRGTHTLFKLERLLITELRTMTFAIISLFAVAAHCWVLSCLAAFMHMRYIQEERRGSVGKRIIFFFLTSTLLCVIIMLPSC